MKIESPLKDKIGIALNESRLLGLEFNPETRVVNCTFSVLSLDANNNRPNDSRVIVLFGDVGKIAASLRKGEWNQTDAEVVPFDISKICPIIQSFEGQPIYGWDFINNTDEWYKQWEDRTSCLYQSDVKIDCMNTIDLFQEYFGEKYIDIRIWFDKIAVINSCSENIGINKFAEDGERAWNAITEQKECAKSFPVIPVKGNEQLIASAIRNINTHLDTRSNSIKQWLRKLFIKRKSINHG